MSFAGRLAVRYHYAFKVLNSSTKSIDQVGIRIDASLPNL